MSALILNPMITFNTTSISILFLSKPSKYYSFLRFKPLGRLDLVSDGNL